MTKIKTIFSWKMLGSEKEEDILNFSNEDVLGFNLSLLSILTNLRRQQEGLGGVSTLNC